MRDIPVFTTDYGVASLILKEIPYKQQAFIHVQDVQPGQLEQLLDECVGFCRAAGAEIIFAAGHPELERYPLHTIIYGMSRPASVQKQGLPRGCLWPVTEQTVGKWRSIYNERMRTVDNAATLTAFDEAHILRTGGAYFVHEDGALWGIGWINGAEILAIASVEQGKGMDTLEALMNIAQVDRFFLQVASTNQRAIRLYESAGFLKTTEHNRWYRVK